MEKRELVMAGIHGQVLGHRLGQIKRKEILLSGSGLGNGSVALVTAADNNGECNAAYLGYCLAELQVGATGKTWQISCRIVGWPEYCCTQ